MNPKPLETAADTDLRLSMGAMQRAALRARQVAHQTGTALVISRQGVLELVYSPDSLPPALGTREPTLPFAKQV